MRNACALCDKPITQPRTGRPRRYCGHRCRQLAYELRRLSPEVLANAYREALARARPARYPILTSPPEPVR